MEKYKLQLIPIWCGTHKLYEYPTNQPILVYIFCSCHFIPNKVLSFIAGMQ